MQTAGRRIKNVVFDLGGVLIEWQPRQMIATIFADREQPPWEFIEVLGSPLWKNMDRGTVSKEQALDLLPPQYNKDDFKKLLDGCLPCFTPIQEGVEILKEVRQRGFKTYVLSNYHDDYFDGIYKKYYDNEVCFKDFEGLTVSSHIKLIKPEKEIYQRLLSDHGLVPEETVFIDDVELNVEAAKGCGLHGVVCHTHTQLRKDLKELEIL